MPTFNQRPEHLPRGYARKTGYVRNRDHEFSAKDISRKNSKGVRATLIMSREHPAIPG